MKTIKCAHCGYEFTYEDMYKATKKEWGILGGGLRV